MTQLAGCIDTAIRGFNTRLSGLEDSTTAAVANIKRESGTFAAKLQAAQSDIATTLEKSNAQPRHSLRT